MFALRHCGASVFKLPLDVVFPRGHVGPPQVSVTLASGMLMMFPSLE